MVALVAIAGAALVAPAPESLAQSNESNDHRPVTSDDLLVRVAERVPGFGGMFLDPESGALKVRIVGDRENAGRTAQAALAEAFDDPELRDRPLVTLDAQYDFGQLRSWYATSRNDVLAVDGVVLGDVDERLNRLRIGVEDLSRDRARVLASLNEDGVPLEAVVVEEAKPVEWESNLQDLHRPLLGGLQIESLEGICSLGFIALRYGVPGFVTNSHCTNTQGGNESTQFGQPYLGTLAGTETVDPPFFTTVGVCPPYKRCRYSDAAFVSIQAPINYNKGAIAKASEWSFNTGPPPWGGGIWEIDDKLRPYVNDGIKKVGRTSGRTDGFVQANCVDFNVAYTNITMICQSDGSYYSNGGDSGAPVFSVGGNGMARLKGIHWGSGGAFSPFYLIADELGTLKVCDDGYTC